MKVYNINTTPYKEEDFFLLTDLSEEDIVEVLMPIVNAERDGYQEYDNEMLVEALQKRYPKRRIELYEEFDTIII